MSFKMSLWIDNEEVLRKIMSCLLRSKEALPITQLLIEVRNLISKAKTKSFEADDVVFWPRAEKEKEIFG
mgnify:FL=1